MSLASSARRPLHRVPLVLGAVFLALAVVPSTSSQAQVTVTMAQGIDPTGLDPAHDTLITSRSIMTNIYDTLVARDAKGGVVASLAESWKFLDDKTLQMNLRKGVKYHNGDPFTADDVIFSYKRYTDRQNPTDLGSYLRDLFKDFEKKDDHTIVIHLPEPTATILGDLNRMPILPEKAFKQIGDREFAAKPVGTGPFKVKRWVRNQELVLEAFDQHWRGRPSVDQYVVKPIPEDFGRFAALRTGSVDIVSNLAPERVDDVKKDPKLKVLAIPSGRGIHIGINLRIKPFDDIRVREALNLAVDVKEIIDTVLGGNGFENGTVCQRALFGHNPNLKPFPYDPERAKKLLAEAGYPNGFETQLLGPTGRYPKDREVQQAVSGQLAKVGIKVGLVTPEWAEFLDQMYARGKHKEPFNGLYMLGTGGETLDCDRTLLQRIYSKSRLGYYVLPHTPEIDAMFFKQKTILDPEERKQYLWKMQERIRADIPWIFLYDQVDIYGVTKRIQWTPRADEFVWAYDIKVQQ